jgi:hypothetical protein
MKLSFFLIFFFTFFGFSQQAKSNNDYNLKGQVQKVIETTSFPEDEVMPGYDIKAIYTLNHDDYLLSIEEPNMRGQIQKSEFLYDKENIIQEIKVTVNGKITSKSIFIKNNNNQVMKIKIEDLNGKSEIVNYYDELGKLPSAGKEYKNGDLSRSWEIEYKNELTSVFTTTISEIKTITFYEYNSNNDIVEVIEKNSKGEMLNRQSSEYKYDSKNNWIEKVVYDSNRKIFLSSKRQIEYW